MIERPNIEWKPLTGYENVYLISNYGDIICKGYTTKNGKYIQPFEKHFEDFKISASGYYLSCAKGSFRESFLHRLVARLFLGEPPDKMRTQINHKDGNKKNNYVGTAQCGYSDGNLEWVSRSENMCHASRAGLLNKDSQLRKQKCKENQKKAASKAKRPVCQLNFDGDLVAEYDSVAQASRMTGIRTAVISCVAHNSGYHKSAHGFLWVYKDSYDPQKNYKYNG